MGNCKPNNSYGSILKSSSIIGGSSGVNYVVGLLRTKIVALLLGASGVGLIGVYNSVLSIGRNVAGMGLASSGVREIAAARSENDYELIGQIQLCLKRMSLLFGAVGWLILALLAPVLSQMLFGDESLSVSIILVGSVLLVSSLQAIYSASLQGYREISSIAKVAVFSAASSTALATGIYWFLGASGIVPALISIALVSLGLSAFYGNRLQIKPKERGWGVTFKHARRLVGLGAAIAWGATIGEVVPFFARALAVNEIGLQASGYYTAAWAISGLFINFLLQAMSADYYPRLSGVVSDRESRDQIVNEQTELGVLLALPGVIALSAFAPVIVVLLYSPDFIEAAALMPWFVLGLFGRITAWPMGMLVLANAHSKTFALMQSLSVVIHVVLVFLCFRIFGLVGLAIGFGLQYLWYNLALACFIHIRYRYRFSRAVCRIILCALLFLFLVAVAEAFLRSWWSWGAMVLLLGFSVIYSSAALYHRVGGHPKLEKLIRFVPAPIHSVLEKMEKFV